MTSLAAVPSPRPDECLECWLQSRLEARPCAGTFDLVEEWARDQAADIDHLIELLADRGGFCDCEVLLNVLDGPLVLDDLVVSCGG